MVVGRGKGCRASVQARTGGEDEPGPEGKPRPIRGRVGKHSERGCSLVIKIFRRESGTYKVHFTTLGVVFLWVCV